MSEYRKCGICEREIPTDEPCVVRQVSPWSEYYGFGQPEPEYYCQDHYDKETSPELFDAPLTTTNEAAK